MKLKEMVGAFYKDFYKAEVCDKGYLDDWHFFALSHSDKSWMNREVTSEEIKRAIFQMGPDKVSSPDVCPLSFFQRFWDVVGESVIQFVKEAFRRGTIPEEMNKVAIFLLPKIEETELLGQS